MCIGITLLSIPKSWSQTPLFAEVLVSDVGNNNNIGKANTSRNVAIDNNGFVYVVFTGSEGIRVSKSENRGESFFTSVQVEATSIANEPEITINDQGIIFIAWVENLNIKLSRSLDQGLTFSPAIIIGSASESDIVFEEIETVHMATFDDFIYIIDRSGANLFVNSNNGIGEFNTISLPNFAYSDVFTDQNGIVYTPRDNPILELFESENNGQTFEEVSLSQFADVYFSSYTLSDGPCGTFIFVAGAGSNGFKIDVSNGEIDAISFGESGVTSHARTLYADNQGTIIDGYKNDSSELVISISFNQGQTFNTPIFISDGDSHNLARNTTFNDIVVTYSQDGQVFLTVFSDVLKGIEIVEPNPSIQACSGSTFDLPFTLIGTFDPSTTFSAILSDASGSFANGIIVGDIITNTDGTITVTLPASLPPSSAYRLLIESITDCTQSQPIIISIGGVALNQPEGLIACGDESGTAEFDLDALIASITAGETDINITFHTSEDDANNNNNPIINTGNYISSTATIWVRGENLQTSACNSVISFEIESVNFSEIKAPVRLQQCDSDQDGITLFNLTEAIAIIANNEDYIYTFYELETDAENGTVSNQISNPMSYENPTALNSTVYTRIVTDNECYVVVPIDLVVVTTQIPQDFQLIYESCDDTIEGTNTDGISSFDFSSANSQIEGLFPMGQSFEITYYLNQSDALQEINSITNLSNFRNNLSLNSQIIWVRIENLISNSCEGLGPHILLNVLDVPLNNPIEDFELCSSNGQASFNLSTKNTEVIGSQTDTIIVHYYETFQNALDDIPIINPNNFVSSGQTIFVRSIFDVNSNSIEDQDECFNAIDMQFNLIVNSSTLSFEPDPLEKCSDQINTVYDLTLSESQITGGDSNLIVYFYENQNDFDTNTPIQNPTNYLNTELIKDILILVDSENGCFAEHLLTLKTTLYDDFNFLPLPIEECEVDNDGLDSFDLTRVEPDLLNLLDISMSNNLNPLNYIINYYVFEDDASLINENIELAINNPISFINTTPFEQTIYARLNPINSSNQQCFAVIPIDLIVNSVARIPFEDQYVICLSNTDEVIDSLSSTFLPTPPIDTQLSAGEYTFQWYSGSEQDVIDNSSAFTLLNETQHVFSPTQAGNYTVIATNIASGCTIMGSTLVVTSYPPESITLELTTALFSNNNILEVIVVGNGEYEYSIDSGSWQSTAFFENLNGGEHIVYVRDLYNCNVIIATKNIIDYPLFFTPNNDGFNDTWSITNIQDLANAKIYIFDRYGKLIKELDPNGGSWDGTYNGNLMPTSDYWFSLQYTEPLDNTLRVLKSHFTLKR